MADETTSTPEATSREAMGDDSEGKPAQTPMAGDGVPLEHQDLNAPKDEPPAHAALGHAVGAVVNIGATGKPIESNAIDAANAVPAGVAQEEISPMTRG